MEPYCHRGWMLTKRAYTRSFLQIEYYTKIEQLMLNLPIIVKDILESEDLKKIKRINVKEETIDAIIGVINYIPVVGGGIASEIQQIKDARQSYLEIDFYRKFLALIYGIQDLQPKDIATFMEEISEKAQDYAGNVITNLINRIDNINKADILANLVRAKTENRITIHDFFRLSSMLERIPYIDLNELKKYQNPYYDKSGDTELLYATGALKLAILDSESENSYTLSNLGALLLEEGMNYKNVQRSKGGTDVAQLEWNGIKDPDPDQLNDDRAMFDFDILRGK